jgi:PIN domain nuclease of toxin-antitoxin system
MQLILDTHALIWWWGNDPLLPEGLRDLLSEDETIVYVSAASALEMAIKVRTGRLPQMERRVAEFHEGVRDDGFHHLVIHHEHAIKAGLLPAVHRDPFDRTIAAQGIIEGLPVMTRDPAFATLGCQVIW